MEFCTTESTTKGLSISDPILSIKPSDELADIVKKISQKFEHLENLIKENYVIDGEADSLTVTTGEYTLSVTSDSNTNYLNFDFSNLSPVAQKVDTTIKVYSTNQYGTLYPIYETSKKDKGSIAIESSLLPIKVVVDHRVIEAGRTVHFTTEKDLNLKTEIKDFMDYTYPIKNYSVKDAVKSLQNKVNFLSTKVK